MKFALPLLIAAFGSVFLPFSAPASSSCTYLFSSVVPVSQAPPMEISSKITLQIESCASECSKPPKLARTIADSLYQSLSKVRGLEKKARGYAILTGIMVTSAAVNSQIAAALPSDMAFLSQLIGQISTLGIYVLGAPIWEPISSGFRKFAFGLQNQNSVAPPTQDMNLESLWQRTQNHYSVNAQMSRNVIHAFLTSAQLNFHQARTALRTGDEDLATDLIAESAVRLRKLFAEVDPADTSIALAVQSTFTRHIVASERLQDIVLNKILLEDPEAKSPQERQYYSTLLESWLKPNKQK